MAEERKFLFEGFLDSAERFPDRAAVEVAGESFSYRDLKYRSASVAATLSTHTPTGGPPLVAIFAYRSMTAYVGILGTLLSGKGYVPLHRFLPVSRTREILERVGCRAIIIDSTSIHEAEEFLSDLSDPMLLIFPETRDVTSLAQRYATHTILGSEDLEPCEAWRPVEPPPRSIAYLLFTSGSTGTPKGVMVSHENATAAISRLSRRYDFTEQDRFSQNCDLMFDGSIFDMFVAWENGAAVCCPSKELLINPGRFISKSKLTVWASVVSIAVFMKRLGALKPGSYPHLRVSLLYGEALPMGIAHAWQEGAPNSVVDNAYGPTEVTVICFMYRWDPLKSPSECMRSIVPIGRPFDGTKILIVDENLNEVAPGYEGELIMGGPQVTLGYWKDQQKTAASYIQLSGKEGVYFKSGDLVLQHSDRDPVHFLGRVDHQVKVLGNRVELGEIEAVLREESGIDLVAAIGWPKTESGVGGIVAFLNTDTFNTGPLLEKISKRLPGYMVPREFYCLPEFPLNRNGKVDRSALTKLLEDKPAT